MRRPPIACCRAAHSLQSAPLQHIWISDDLLALALHRFFRANGPHQTRHGSNVPGPLEARRRAAKRRMTAQASMHPQSGLPTPMFNLGALFGSRERGPPVWKYEPPSPRKGEPSSSAPDNGRQLQYASAPSRPAAPDQYPTEPISHRFFSPDDTFQTIWDEPRIGGSAAKRRSIGKIVRTPLDCELTEIDMGATAIKAQADAVRDTRIASQTMHREHIEQTKASSQTLDQQVLDRSDIERHFISFQEKIASGIELPENSQHVFLHRAFRSCYPGSDDMGYFSLLALQHLIQVQWNPGHIVACLSEPRVSVPHISTTEGLAFLRILERMVMGTPHRIKRIGRLYQKLVDVASQKAKSSGVHQDEGLCLLIRGLWNSTRWQVHKVEGPVVEVLCELGKRVSDHRLQKNLVPMLEDPVNAIEQIVLLITDCTRHPDLISLGVNVLEHIPRTPLQSLITLMPSRLLKSKSEAPVYNVSPSRLQRFETWLKLLRGLDRKATNVPGEIKLLDFAFRNLAYRLANIRAPSALVTALLYSLAGHRSLAEISPDRVISFIDSCVPELMKQQISKHPLNELLARLVSELEEASLPNHGVVELMLPLIHQREGIQSAVDLLRRIETRGSTLSETAFFGEFMEHVLDQVRDPDHLQNEQQRQHYAFALNACQQLQQVQVKLGARAHAQGEKLKGLQARWQFQHILDRAKDARVVPLAYRNMRSDIPMTQRVGLIHQFAYQYSVDRTRSHRQNWRSIYYLYKYLRLNNLDIGPLFTKAVVRVCITHPLSENHFVSARRLIWVCQMVAKVEGKDVARRIEHIFWVWRGDLILHAKKTLVACGGAGKAHVSTMKRLGLI